MRVKWTICLTKYTFLVMLNGNRAVNCNEWRARNERNLGNRLFTGSQKHVTHTQQGQATLILEVEPLQHFLGSYKTFLPVICQKTRGPTVQG